MAKSCTIHHILRKRRTNRKQRREKAGAIAGNRTATLFLFSSPNTPRWLEAHTRKRRGCHAMLPILRKYALYARSNLDNSAQAALSIAERPIQRQKFIRVESFPFTQSSPPPSPSDTAIPLALLGSVASVGLQASTLQLRGRSIRVSGDGSAVAH